MKHPSLDFSEKSKKKKKYINFDFHFAWSLQKNILT